MQEGAAMCARACTFFFAALFPVAGEQVAERVINLKQAQTVQNVVEAVVVVRSVTDIRQVSAGDGEKSVTVRGTPDEIRLAGWLIAALDEPAGAAQEYGAPGASDEKYRVFHLTHSQTPQELQEMSILVRSLADARYVFVYRPTKALVIRGSAWRIALAEWLIGELNQPAETPTPAEPREYRLQGGSDIVPPADVFVRIFYPGARTPKELTDLATGMRSAAGPLQRSFINTARRAIIVRASAEKMAQAEQALRQLQ
jgi:type II secretory pathway component GspD/PulD (secretin)